MKHLKTYEMIEEEPQIGDWVVCKDQSPAIPDKEADFISSNIGKISKFNGSDTYFHYIVYYKDSENNRYFVGHERKMNRKEIIYHSKNKEDCEAFLAMNRYNL